MKHLAIGLFAISCFGQTSTLRVFSEFTRVDPFGQIVPQDRGSAPPRTILSPGVPRNAFSSLRIVVTFDKPATYILDIGQNPENAVKVTLYKERFEKHGDRWIPDGLEAVRVPYEAKFPEDNGIPGQTTVTFWLDMWVDRSAPVDRIKVEPQLWANYAADWFTYPMEVRVLEAVLPSGPVSPGGLPAVTQRSDAAAMGPLRSKYCGKREPAGSSQAVTDRSLLRRNVAQHLRRQDAAANAKLLKAYGATTVQAFCTTASLPGVGPEWYLRFKDSLFASK